MKGMDPLIATVVLIIIAVAVAATIANWQAWFLPSYSAQISNQSLSQIQCSRAGIMLDNVAYDCRGDCRPGVDNHTLSLKIRNTGDISLPLYKLYLENTAGELFEFNLSTTLALDQIYDYNYTYREPQPPQNTCPSINRSISRISIATACPSMPSIFDGSIITWINC